MLSKQKGFELYTKLDEDYIQRGNEVYVTVSTTFHIEPSLIRHLKTRFLPCNYRIFSMHNAYPLIGCKYKTWCGMCNDFEVLEYEKLYNDQKYSVIYNDEILVDIFIDNNRFDRDGGEDVFVKRSTILKNSYSYYPVYANDGTKTFGIFWDPASKLDNSFVLVAEIFHDDVRGWMAKIVNGVNLIETLPNGDKMVIQKPEQIEIVKQMLLDYNRGALDYDNILTIQFDSGARGGGFDAAAVLLNTWTDKQGKSHVGIIDENDPYMKLRLDDYPEAIRKLVLFNFKRDKVQAYERTQQAINQGLIMFPKSLNARNEMEFEE